MALQDKTIKLCNCNRTMPLDAKALAEHLNRRLGFRAPRFLLQIPSLPRNATGKIRRDVLAEMASRHIG